jgi:6-hydroxytryprostatin B O-methyltransferase
VHDFFTPQTTTANAYVLKLVCHDWPNDKAAENIRNILPVMQTATKIIIVDTVVPEPGEVPWHWQGIKSLVRL